MLVLFRTIWKPKRKIETKTSNRTKLEECSQIHASIMVHYSKALKLVVPSSDNLVSHSGEVCNVSGLILSTGGDTLADTQSVAVELH